MIITAIDQAVDLMKAREARLELDISLLTARLDEARTDRMKIETLRDQEAKKATPR